MSEFETVVALLRQQNEYFGAQLTEIKADLRDIKGELTEVKYQTTKTNDTVSRHTQEIASLVKGDPGKAPLLTMSDGKLIRTAVGLAISLGTALYFAARWLVANWGSLIPGLMGMFPL
jgi:hypothetical protein